MFLIICGVVFIIEAVIILQIAKKNLSAGSAGNLYDLTGVKGTTRGSVGRLVDSFELEEYRKLLQRKRSKF